MSEKPISSSREARRKTVGDVGDAGDIVVTIGNNPPGCGCGSGLKADYSLRANGRLASLLFGVTVFLCATSAASASAVRPNYPKRKTPGTRGSAEDSTCNSWLCSLRLVSIESGLSTQPLGDTFKNQF